MNERSNQASHGTPLPSPGGNMVQIPMNSQPMGSMSQMTQQPAHYVRTQPNQTYARGGGGQGYQSSNNSRGNHPQQGVQRVLTYTGSVQQNSMPMSGQQNIIVRAGNQVQHPTSAPPTQHSRQGAPIHGVVQHRVINHQNDQQQFISPGQRVNEMSGHPPNFRTSSNMGGFEVKKTSGPVQQHQMVHYSGNNQQQMVGNHNGLLIQQAPSTALSGGNNGIKPTPKEEYRGIKKNFKYLVYENECYQEELRNLQRKLLKLSRDKNFLLDRLLQYEKLSDSSDDSDSSVKTIEDKSTKAKATKRTRATTAPKKRAAAGTGGSNGPAPKKVSIQDASSSLSTVPTKASPPKAKVEITSLSSQALVRSNAMALQHQQYNSMEMNKQHSPVMSPNLHMVPNQIISPVSGNNDYTTLTNISSGNNEGMDMYDDMSNQQHLNMNYMDEGMMEMSDGNIDNPYMGGHNL
uniref:INO80 complex subunit E n=1 Tax=Rhabditophanes sp. KR3021 TaxID=114890 RepID=A0AC35UD60_9BILA